MLAARRIARLAVRTTIVGGEERADDELPELDRRHSAADLLHDAAVLVPHRFRLGDRVDAAVVPQVRPAYAGDRRPDDGVRRLDDRRGVALLEAHVTRTIENCSSHHCVSFLLRDPARYCSSLTLSIHSTTLPLSCSWIAMCIIAVVGVAPCQCFSPGGHAITSPGRISSTGPPQLCTQPQPAVTINV